MPDLFVSWSDYHRTIESLIADIHASDWAFDHIVCIARGGTRVGDIIARAYRKPMAVIYAQYDADETPRISPQIAALKELSGAVLLVDDVSITGATLASVKAALYARHPLVREIRTAVLWRQGSCKEAPDYSAVFLAHNPRIHPPYEAYDLSSLQALVDRTRRGLTKC